MKDKLRTKRIIKLSSMIGGGILLASALGATLSSCVIKIERPGGSSGQVQTSTKEINWNSKNLEQELVMDSDGLVFSDISKTELIAVNPKKFNKTSVSLPATVKKITGYTEIKYVNGIKTKVARGAFEGITVLQSLTTQSQVRLSSIGNNSFKDCSNLASVSLPESTTSIGNSAFENCAKLTNINLENVTKIGVGAFRNSFKTSTYKSEVGEQSSSSRQLAQPKAGSQINLQKVMTIGDEAFLGCSELSSVDLSSNTSLIAIGTKAFSNCTKLTQINLQNTLLTALSEGVFLNSGLNNITWPTNINTISASALSGTKFTNITIPASVSYLGNNAFSSAAQLNTINFQANSGISYLGSGFISGTNITTLDLTNLSNITQLQTGILSNNTKLTTVKLPSQLQTIDDNAFDGCSVLSDVNFNAINTLNRIGSNAFNGCSKLTSVNLGSGVSELGDGAFANSGISSVNLQNTQIRTISNGLFQNSGSLTSITLPNGLTTIGDEAFNGCSSLGSLTIPASVTTIGSKFLNGTNVSNLNLQNNTNITTIGNNMFDGNTKLNSITLPNSLQSIGNEAFQNTTKLTSISIPQTVSSIGDGAFKGSKMANVTFAGNNTNNLNIGASAFENVTTMSNISLPTNTRTIGASAFKGSNVNKVLASSNENSNLPSSLTSIGAEAFKNTKLTNVTIPASVNNNVGTGAFSNISTLTTFDASHLTSIPASIVQVPISNSPQTRLNKVKLNDNLTSIGASAFKGNTSLSNNGIYVNNNNNSNSVTLPNKLTTISAGAFEGTGLNGALNLNANLTTIGNSAFKSTQLTSVSGSNASKLTTIGPSSFSNISGLTSITLHSNTTIIGDSAFNGCGQLKTINSSSSNSSNSTSLKFPTTITSVGANAFNDTGITNLEIQANSSLTSIGQNAFGSVTKLEYKNNKALPNNFFNGFSSLTNVTMTGAGITSLTGSTTSNITNLDLNGTGLTTIDGNTFSNKSGLTSVQLPSTLTSIGANAFSGASNLTNIQLGSTKVESIGANAFKNATQLNNVTLPNTLTTIGNNAFEGVNQLSTISGGENVTTIGDSAFKGVTLNNVGGITAWRKIESIGASAFEGVSTLTSLNTSKVTSLGASALKGTGVTNLDLSALEVIPNSAFENASNLTSVSNLNSLTTIGNNAFKGTKVNIINANNLTSIGNNAFNGVNQLQSVTSQKLQSVGANAFVGTQIQSLTSDSLTIIGESAFSGLTNFNEITATNVTSVGANAFNGTKLTEFNSEKLTTIGASAFKGNSLTSFTAPATLTSIGAGAFENNEKLTKVDLSQTSLTSLPADLFKTSTHPSTGIDSVGRAKRSTVATDPQTQAHGFEVVLPETLKSINKTTFANSNLKSIDLSKNTFTNTTFPAEAFMNCEDLETVLLPSNIKTLNSSTFTNTPKLQEITLPGSATKIEVSGNTIPNVLVESSTRADGQLTRIYFDVYSKDSSNQDWFNNINWEQVANIMNIFAGQSSTLQNGNEWSSIDLNENTVNKNWSLGSGNVDLESEMSSPTKKCNEITWTYTRNINSENSRPKATINGIAKLYRGYSTSSSDTQGRLNGRAYLFGEKVTSQSPNTRTRRDAAQQTTTPVLVNVFINIY